MAEIRYYRWSGAFRLRDGVAWFRRASGEGFSIKAPWNRPMFSERIGAKAPIFRVLGFRVFKLAPPPPLDRTFYRPLHMGTLERRW